MTSSYSEWFEKKRKRLQQDAEKKKRDELISSLSPDNILSEREAFFAKRRGDEAELRKKWQDLYKKAINYYNNEGYKTFFDTYSGTRNAEGYVNSRDTSKWYRELKELNKKDNEGIEELLAELDQYSRYYNEDAVKYVRELISEKQKAYSDVMTDAGKFRDHWAQWATEDDYNKALWESDFYSKLQSGNIGAADALYKQKYGDNPPAEGDEGYQYFEYLKSAALPDYQKYNGMSSSDLLSEKDKLSGDLKLTAGFTPADRLKVANSKMGIADYDDFKRSAELMYVEDMIPYQQLLEVDLGASKAEKEEIQRDHQEYKQLALQLTNLETEYARVGVENAREQAEADLPDVVARINAILEKYGTDNKGLQSLAYEKQKSYNEAERAQRLDALVKGASEISGMHPMTELLGSMESDGRGNFNRVALAEQGMSVLNKDTLEEREAVPYPVYMTKDEKQVYNAYFAGGQYDKAEEYYQLLLPELKKRKESEDLGKVANFTDKLAGSGIPSALSVLSSLGSAVEYVGDAANYLVDRSIDPYSAEMDTNILAKTTNAIRGTASEKLNLEIAGFDVADFVYNTGMSGLDSLAASVIPGGGVVLGLSAAAQATNDALERGMSSEQAFWNGAISGVFEGLFESISIGKFKSLQEGVVKGGKDIAKNIAKSMLVNASEEAATELANILYDTLANGDFSNYENMVRQYMSEGMTPEEAEARAKDDLFWQVVESAASGAIMGAGFGGIGSAKAYSNAKNAALDTYGSDSQAVIDESLALDPNNKLAQRLQGKLEVGKAPSTSKLGKLALQNVNAAENAMVEQDKAREQADREKAIKDINAQNRLAGKIHDKEALSKIAQTVTKALMGEQVSNAELRKVAENQAALTLVGKELDMEGRFKVGTTTVSDLRSALAQKQSPKARLSTQNVISGFAAFFNMDEAAERSLMVNYAADVKNAQDGKTINPEDYAATYGAVYAAGKKGTDISEVSGDAAKVLSKTAIAQAYRAGQMEAKNNATVAETATVSEKVSDSASVTQSPAESTQSYVASEGTAAIPSESAREFKGAVTGKTYSAEAATLLSTAKIREIDSNKSYYMLDSLEIPKAEQKAWIDAGIAQARNVRGETVATVNTTVLKDEVKRRENSSQKVLQKDGGGGTIESTQSRRENGDGKENESGLLPGNPVSYGGGYSEVSSKGKGTSGDVDSSRIHGEPGGVGVLSEDTEGRRISSDTLSKISETAVVDEDGKPISLYHATDKLFDKFAIGDIGFHFGLKEQADSRARRKKIAHPRYINAYLNIKNPLRAKSDYMNWHANAVALNLWNEGILSDAEMQEVVSLWTQGKNYDSPAAVRLREILESKGYDGIAYPNGYEGEGTSYIAFHDEQIVRVEVENQKENAIAPERVVYSSKTAKAYDAIPGNKLTKEQKKVTDVAAQIGRKVIFAVTTNANGVEVDGFIAKNGDIYINPNKNVSPMAFVLKHELAHFAQRAGRKYQDFKNAVRSSQTFKNWLKEKGLTERQYNEQIRAERASIGQKLDEPGATAEIISNFVGDMLFGDNNTISEDLVRELKPDQRKTVRDYIRSFFSWLKSKFVGDAGKAKMELWKLEKAFGAAYRAAVESSQKTSTQNEEFSYAGVNAETADKMSLANAEKMLADGVDSETIRKETGWFKWYDGKWRFEIDDSQAVWHLDTAKPNPKRLFEFGEKIFHLSDILDHPALYEAYPQLKNVTVWENPNAHTTGYVVGRSTDAITVRSLADNNLNKDILTHEIQHLIQNIEGFATGASPEQFSYKAWGETEYEAYERRNEIASKLYAILRKHGVSIKKTDVYVVRTAFEIRDSIIDYNFMLIESLADNNERTRALLDDYYKQVQILNLTTPEGQYHAVPGEIEAYDVQARRRKTSEERKNTRPNMDREDVVLAEGVSYYQAGSIDEDEDVKSIRQQLEKSKDKLAEITPIKSKYPPQQFKNAKEALEWAVNVLKSSGQLIQRQGYGDVVLDEKRLKNGLSYLKTDAEKVAFSLIPKVIKNGIEIGRHPKHKGRNYDTVTFALPVTVGNTTGYMAVVIREEGKKYFKLHRVFMPDGSLFEFTETKKSNAETAGLQNANVSPTNVASNSSISQKTDLSTQKSKKVLEDGGEQFSYTPQNEKIEDVFERIRSGELSLNDAEKLLKKPEVDNPVTIANIKKEDMGSTPNVNKKTKGNVGGGDSKFAGSVQRSSIFNEEFKKEVSENSFVKHYAAITNKETLAEAAKRLDQGGEAYVTEWLSKKTVHMDTVDTVVGFILLKRYQDVGNYEGATAVAQKVRDVGTLSGQRVQAFSILGRFDADMMQAYAQKELDKAWELAIQGRSDAWIEKHKEQFKLTDEDISFIRDNIMYAAKMPENSRERAIALAQITMLIQSKIPPTRGQSYKAWQRVSMLLNPKTQIRNVLGNAMMAPVFVASDWFSSPVDYIISKKTGVRTTGVTGLHGNAANFRAMGKGFAESYDDWKRHINTKADEQNRFEIGQGKSFDETKWGRIAKIMNGFDRFTSFLLDAGDRPFYEMWFINSLNEQMRLNNVTEPTEAMVQIAVDEALSRTWQDENRMTKLVSGIKKAANQISIAGYGMGDVLIKFTKTPANLTKAIYDFSPAAIATIAPDAVRLGKAIKNGTATPSMQKKFVSNFGKMAAGTMLYVIFAALYAAGHIKGSSDEDKDVAAFEKYIQGIPEYSIKIGGKWFSYDWAQPIGAVPAIIADYMESREEGSGAIDSVINAFKAGGEVLFNQSFMTSFKTLFSAESFSEGLLDIILGEVTVPVPTVFSQLANVLDEKRRVAYDGTSEFKSALNRALIKIPGIRNMLEADIDVLGREVDNSQKSWFNAFFNPANVYTDTSTDVTDHAYEIYQSTGDVGAIPAKAPYSVKLQGKNIKLDDAQRAQYQKAMGESASDLIEILLENDVYRAMNDEEKLAVLKQVYSYSAAVAKDQLDWADDYEVISGIVPYITEKDFNAMSEEERYKIVSDYIFSDYEGMEDIDSDIGQSNFIINKKTANLVLSATLVGDIDKAVELIDGIESRVETYGWDEENTAAEIKDRKTSVKTSITRYWKEAYVYAYYKNDYDQQDKIFDMLVKLGLYGDETEVEKKLSEWVEAYEEEK